uniref:G-protein coupled receptors family 1 profile domain-containing protein n=1 Tax=Pygocentrus nattereri TaxID=42514 RepID=A0AAR2J6V3_PYGNA
MENMTFNSLIMQLEGLVVPDQFLYPTFLFFLIFYVLIMLTNIGIVLIISMEQNLHEPMYILFCNLPFNDVIGNSITIPRLLVDLLRPASERTISYTECVVQAFCTHMYATTSHTVLMIMAFDRYVAISNPFCDNASLFKLSCENPYINNIYGLAFTVFLLVSSMGSIALTYAKITAVCLTRKNKSLNSKALKTCSTHLAVYLVMLLSGLLIIILHRFPGYADYRKLSALLFHIIPGLLNPVIYAVQSTEIRHVMIKLLSNNFLK